MQQDNDIDPRQVRDFAIAALGRLIESISVSKTVVLTIDDMQWGDVDSSILINRLLQLGFGYRPMPPRTLRLPNLTAIPPGPRYLYRSSNESISQACP